MQPRRKVHIILALNIQRLAFTEVCAARLEACVLWLVNAVFISRYGISDLPRPHTIAASSPVPVNGSLPPPSSRPYIRVAGRAGVGGAAGRVEVVVVG